MVIPTVALKILGGAVAVGALASSVAVPTALSMNVSSEVVLNGFPEDKKQDFKDKCHLLIKEEDGDKREDDILYLLACDKGNASVAEFYFYSSGSEPQKFIKLEQQNTLGNKRTKVKVKTEVAGGVGSGGADFTSSNGDWTRLIGKNLVDCSITKNDGEGGNRRWNVRCPRGGAGEEIPLTPVII